ncbi:cytochrome c biogenesis CcdA family protein [Nocardiopsis sp. EMB25]|uniref:cytochrome c biogenesis CcdA family protein n=1 Tax=Nocardiopsis TaxID=2013 RepID=UPI00034A457D|nr:MULTISPECIES: cytochrome c biogenesis CcdA family protein [Nocardiopsis]MCY9787463.1 cytochrome c biogenesis CcdA family protein [Nocardiopsis sp. EMB25]
MSQLPIAIALVAGMLAVLNPCGFALLPGYLALLVASDGGDGGGGATAGGARWRPLGRALATTAAMTCGFTFVFAGFGLVVTPLALSVERHLPWVTVVIGAALVGLGAWLAAGREVTLLLPKPSPGRPARSLRWALVYGITYAIASLSCTVGPFLALTTAALRSTSPVGVVAVFLAYALGMGLVVGVLTVAVALARDSVASRLRRAMPYVTRAGGVLLVLAGLYVAYYGWFELRVFSGGSADDPVVGAATRVQAELVRLLESVGPWWTALVLTALVTGVGGLGWWRSRRR